MSDTTGVMNDITGVMNDITGVMSDTTGVMNDITGVMSDTTDVMNDITGQRCMSDIMEWVIILLSGVFPEFRAPRSPWPMSNSV